VSKIVIRSSFCRALLSLDVGTSDKNLRSSADRAKESIDRVFERPTMRPRKRETAEGWIGSGWISSFAASIVGIVDGDLVSTSETTLGGSRTTGFGWSDVLFGSTATGDSARGVEVFGEFAPELAIGEVDCFELPSTDKLWAFRPKKENKPPAFFFPSSSGDSPWAEGSTIFQPTGATSSDVAIGLALIAASQEFKPFDARYMAIGLERVDVQCLVSLSDSDICFIVNVFANGTVGDKVMSSGDNLVKTEFLQRSLGVNVKSVKHCTTHKPSISKSRLSLTPALDGPGSSHISLEYSSNCRNIEESNSGGCVSY